jgi:hypothetical protein
MKIHRWGALALAVSLFGGAAQAQERGRTDGPEGSEYGKGGYSRAPLGGNFSIQLDWGGAVLDNGANGGTPMVIGGTLTFWQDDWFLLDLSGAYLANGKRTDLLIGPRFRTPYWPVSLSLGLKAGAIFFPQVLDTSSTVRFGLSPQVGLDLLFNDKIPLGLNYALDIPIGTPAGVDLIAHRIYLSVGYRF